MCCSCDAVNEHQEVGRLHIDRVFLVKVDEPAPSHRLRQANLRHVAFWGQIRQVDGYHLFTGNAGQAFCHLARTASWRQPCGLSAMTKTVSPAKYWLRSAVQSPGTFRGSCSNKAFLAHSERPGSSPSQTKTVS